MTRTFLLGALGYPALEILYRGRTHYSMAIAGGVSAMLIKAIWRKRWSLAQKAIFCGGGITLLEYLAGRIWNKNFDVWDYRNQPLNLQGQICLRFTTLWCLMSAGVMTILTFLDRNRGSD